MVLLGFIHLLFFMTFMAIRLTIEIWILAGRLFAFLYREVLVPGARAASAGMAGLAETIAARNADGEHGWTAGDDQQLEQWRDRGRY